MIQEDYVSFETAKLLKEKGFDNDVICTDCWYDEDGDLHRRGNYYYSGAPVYHKDTCCNAPTLQMAMKWLREVHNIFIDISSRFSKNADKDVCFSYSCKKLIDTYKNSYEIGDGEWLNYEQACEASIKYCLKNLI